MASIPNNRIPRERPLGEVINDLKVELKDFISVRLQMLRSEMNEKLGAIKSSAPMLIVGALMGVMAFVLLTGALVALVAMAFQNEPYQYALAFGIVFVVYALVAAVCLSFAYNNIRSRGLAPERTMRVLKQDQIWMQSEVRSEL